jgi:hypothetical protein
MKLSKVKGGYFAVATTCCLLITMGWAQDEKPAQTDIAKRLQAAAEVFQEIMQAPDKGISDKILSDAKCVIVIPSMVKVAIGFGGQHGKGVVTCRTPNGWSAPALVTMTGGSWGLQFGGEAVDLVMPVMNQKGVDHLLSSKFKAVIEAAYQRRRTVISQESPLFPIRHFSRCLVCLPRFAGMETRDGKNTNPIIPQIW